MRSSRTTERAAVLATLLAATAAQAAPAPDKPKLVVVVVVDQLRRADLDRLAPHFTGGFKRLQGGGAILDGHYGQQNTYTGPGHAMILSGSYGYLNGIIQNKWFNRAANRSEGMLFDGDSKAIGQGDPDPGDDTSPKNFMGSTVGDELRAAAGGSAKAISLALKERGALLLGGRTGTAYFFGEKTGEMTTSTYYMPEVPAWVKSFNGEGLVAKAFGSTWDRALPESADIYKNADDAPWEADVAGLGRTFPHKLDGKEKAPGPKFYEAFMTSPAGVDYTFAFARAAVEGEQLGGRGPTDLLAVSVSGTDYVGHTFGNLSQEYMDTLVRTDRALGTFFTYLDGKLGKNGWACVLTADHGAALPPEQAKKLGLGGERTKKAQIKAAVTKALDDRFGKGEWVVALEDPSIYLNRKLVEERKLDSALVEETAGEGLLTLPGFIGYVTRSALVRGALPPTMASRAIARSFFAPRAGDVIAVQAPFSFWGKYGEKDAGGSHGSFYRYDTDVPVFFLGPWFTPGEHGVIEMVDVAATVSQVLKLTPPSACEGRPVQRLLRGARE